MENLRDLLIEDIPSIDVRAPVEFLQGHLPGAVNLPILNDDERALIGLTYKEKGSAAAEALGYQIISGEVKNTRVQEWVSFLEKNPRAFIYCFRGGQRSQITQGWIREAGIERPLLKGGYKQGRNYLMAEIDGFSARHELFILSGSTGSGKTRFLKDITDFFPALDLESLAAHRGSAFGAMDRPQPTQINFENQLALSMLKLEKKRGSTQSVLVEDESRLIGHRALPLSLFDKMRESPVIWLVEEFESRVAHILQEYILETAIGRGVTEAGLLVFEKHKNSVRAITRKLGGLRAQEILDLMEKSKLEFIDGKVSDTNKEWIALLLSYYYDPLYHDSLERRKVRIAFKGNRADCAEFLKNIE
jgi:tRNA 2-selenouridine synthase